MLAFYIIIIDENMGNNDDGHESWMGTDYPRVEIERKFWNLEFFWNRTRVAVSNVLKFTRKIRKHVLCRSGKNSQNVSDAFFLFLGFVNTHAPPTKTSVLLLHPVAKWFFSLSINFIEFLFLHR